MIDRKFMLYATKEDAIDSAAHMVPKAPGWKITGEHSCYGNSHKPFVAMIFKNMPSGRSIFVYPGELTYGHGLCVAMHTHEPTNSVGTGISVLDAVTDLVNKIKESHEKFRENCMEPISSITEELDRISTQSEIGVELTDEDAIAVILDELTLPVAYAENTRHAFLVAGSTVCAIDDEHVIRACDQHNTKVEASKAKIRLMLAKRRDKMVKAMNDARLPVNMYESMYRSGHEVGVDTCIKIAGG